MCSGYEQSRSLANATPRFHKVLHIGLLLYVAVGASSLTSTSLCNHSCTLAFAAAAGSCSCCSCIAAPAAALNVTVTGRLGQERLSLVFAAPLLLTVPLLLLLLCTHLRHRVAGPGASQFSAAPLVPAAAAPQLGQPISSPHLAGLRHPLCSPQPGIWQSSKHPPSCRGHAFSPGRLVEGAFRLHFPRASGSQVSWLGRAGYRISILLLYIYI
jgi:hypothetical protein